MYIHTHSYQITEFQEGAPGGFLQTTKRLHNDPSELDMYLSYIYRLSYSQDKVQGMAIRFVPLRPPEQTL